MTLPLWRTPSRKLIWHTGDIALMENTIKEVDLAYADDIALMENTIKEADLAYADGIALMENTFKEAEGS